MTYMHQTMQDNLENHKLVLYFRPIVNDISMLT